MALYRYTILGCGSSGGVPRADGDWGVCDPSNPKNRRLRCSLLIERGDDLDAVENGDKVTRLLVDTSPDFRQQWLNVGSPALHGIFYTHDHADQTHGIDDVRALVYRQHIRFPAWMNDETHQRLTRRFSYIFEAPAHSLYPPLLDAKKLPERGEVLLCEGPGGPITARVFPVEHGRVTCAALVVGGMAYTPDVSAIAPEDLSTVSGISLWIVDCLKNTPHPTHAHFQQVMDWRDAVRPARMALTNLHTDHDYEALRAQCPPGVEPVYDGWQGVSLSD
ncbi:MBL fold metallo-hydrolase [Woodsholea maritima]|uniref:MBL fold metallo-hydrolase n=1 Tax=Woodsholea maritima TaxID=240237 RepID=UPI00037F4ED8|nr:MBL fold metallo-hydrolase [Woodsholea maritima]